jgi:microcin C transport system substrate-binding protein
VNKETGVKPKLLFLVAALSLTLAIGCGQKTSPETGSGASTPVARTGPVSTNKADYPVFPDADAGADPAVPAEQGGKGFTGQGWETNTDFDLIGDPHAVKGGALRTQLVDFPSTIRLEGPEANTYFNFGITYMAYESLLAIHPTTQDYIPSLATHWQISPDHMTFRYRINPNARFSDGTPVTADDVVASYDFRMDRTLQSPATRLNLEKLDRPVAESKYIVRVHAKKLNWRNFLEFSTSSMLIFPAHILKNLSGEQYIKNYNYKLLPGTGPYTIEEADIDKGKSITVRRRKDYWAANSRANVGLNNFDEMRFVVVRDENLAFEQFKKGEVDAYLISRARQWVEETNFDTVQRGLTQKRKVYNNEPQGFQGIAFNTRMAPYNDIRVRKALTLLFNRKQLIEKIMFNQYVPQNSYEAGSPYENPNNPPNDYDPQTALKLLADAGWSSRDAQGRLVKNGVPLQLELLYDVKTFEPHLTVYQEDLRRVGINLNLRLITFETMFQMLNQRKFQMALMAWGSSPFPDPETMWHSSLADVNSSNNFTGFKDPRVDQLCVEYDHAFDVKDRIRVIREIDGILADAYQYILLWNAPYTRFIYWNKFGTPPGYISRTGDFYGGYKMYGIYQLWWADPAKEARLQQAMRDPSMRLEVGPSDDRYWLEYSAREQATHR